MIKKIGLIALTASIMLLTGCGSSGSNDTNTETTSTEAATPVFTSELVVGKTYTAIGAEDEFTLTFTKTEVHLVELGEESILTYTIDVNGKMIINAPKEKITETLVSIEANGDLKVIQSFNTEELELTWVLH